MDILQEIYLLKKQVERKWQNEDCIVGAQKFAELLTTIVKNCNIPDVVVPKGTLPCKQCSGDGGGVTDNGWEICDCQK